MGQLTNLYVSQSYQGLLKMTDSTNGLTNTLQTVQTGDGDNSPLQMSLTQVNITGSLTVNGNPVSNVDTGSLVTTSSFNAYTSSIDTRIDGIEAKTGSYATTGSNTFIGSQIIEGNVTFTSNSFVSSDNVSGALYISSLNQGTLYINADGGEGNVNIGHNGWTGKLNVTGSLGVTNIQGTGSLFLQPNQGDVRFVEIYNTSPTDTHITASGGQIFLGDDQTYVKVDNYGSVERIDVVAGNELNVSSSVVNVTSSLHQSGTFYPDQVDWINSSIVQSTGSYILTTNISGVTEYDSYQNVASALQPFINTGSLPSGLVSGSSQISYTGITDVPSGIISGSQQISDLGYATTGSNIFNGTQTITGSVNITGNISATSASFTYVNTVYETASVIYSSGSNQFGDASDDTQTLYGTVNLPNGPLVVTGSVTSSAGFNGNLTGTASYATNALSASQAQNAVSASWAPDNSNRDGLINTGSAASTQSITGSLILSGSAGPELDVKGDQNNTGSVNISGSLNVVGPVGLNLLQPNPFKQNLTLLGGVNHFTSSTILNNYLNAITTSLSNNDNNFVLPPGGVFGTNIANLTGSVFISGSNNIITNLGSATPASAGRRQIVGSGNYVITVPTINTSSLTIPQINNNYNGGGVSFTLATGSAAGNNTHIFGSNVHIGNIIWNHPSASITTGAAGSSISNNVNVGTIQSTTIGPTILTTQATLTNNVISNANVQLNHISSSIQFGQNIVGGNGLTFNNRYYTTGSNNFLASAANIFAGQGITINTAGAPSTNVSRTLVGNIIGGQTVNVSLEANNTDNGGLRNSIVYGQGIIASGSHSATSTTVNSTVMVGRWNGEDNGLADSARTVFAVGTGTGASNRRTGFSIDSGSNVVTSGSFSSIGNVNVTGSLNVSGSNPTIKLNGNTSINGVTNVLTVTGSATIQHSVAGQNALTVINSTGLSQPGLEVQGTTTLLGNTLISGSALPLRIVGQSMTNVGLQVTGETTLIGNTTISGSNPLRVGIDNNISVIQKLGGSQWLYRDGDNNTVVGNANGVGSGFFPGSEKNMIFNGFATPFATGSNNVFIQGGGDNFISGSSNVFIGGHNGHAGGSDNLLIGATSYSSGSLFDSKFELGTIASPRIFHKQGADPLQIGDDVQVTGSLRVSGDVMFASGSNTTMGTFALNGGNPGTATVSNTLVTANSLIFLTKQTNTNSGNGTVSVTSKGSGTFSVTSDHNGDADTVAYLIINPA